MTEIKSLICILLNNKERDCDHPEIQITGLFIKNIVILGIGRSKHLPHFFLQPEMNHLVFICHHKYSKKSLFSVPLDYFDRINLEVNGLEASLVSI